MTEFCLFLCGMPLKTSKAPTAVSAPPRHKTQDTSHFQVLGTGHAGAMAQASPWLTENKELQRSTRMRFCVCVCVYNSPFYVGSSNRISLAGPEKLRGGRNSINTL